MNKIKKGWHFGLFNYERISYYPRDSDSLFDWEIRLRYLRSGYIEVSPRYNTEFKVELEENSQISKAQLLSLEVEIGVSFKILEEGFKLLLTYAGQYQ